MRLRAAIVLCLGLITGSVNAENLTLPRAQRPEWLRRDGIVMAGSWEPLLFRVRRDGAPGYEPTPERQAAYQREHSPEMVARLKDMGVNFVMLHCYKGGGMAAERESMADAVRFAKLCHEAGMHVGVYACSATVMWELMAKEVPQAKDWLLLDPQGKPYPYGHATYRYYLNRNHPDAQAYLKRVLRFAVEEIRTDLIHLDNHFHSPGWDACSVERFRRYLAEQFTPEQRVSMGADPVERVQPPSQGSPATLQYAWRDFCCASLAESYQGLSRYARSLRSDILMEMNPGGVGKKLNLPVDHGRLLQGGEALWDEGAAPGYVKGQLRSRIRTYKVARRMENTTFTYTTNPLELAESMAFNLDCLGAICWFEYGEVTSYPGQKNPASKEIDRFVRFYHRRHDLLRDAAVVADVAVLRHFPAMAYCSPKDADLIGRIEEQLIDQRHAFQIIFDQQLDDLSRYRALILANCEAMSDQQAARIRRFVASGGKLCVLGDLATQDQWKTPRSQPTLADLPATSIVRVDRGGDWPAAVRQACNNQPSLTIDAPHGLCVELAEQPQRRLVHLVNYRADTPAANVGVRLRLPASRHARSVTLASPEHDSDIVVSFEERQGEVVFRVPQVNVYEIAVVSF